jgi:hypothetical protein
VVDLRERAIAFDDRVVEALGPVDRLHGCGAGEHRHGGVEALHGGVSNRQRRQRGQRPAAGSISHQKVSGLTPGRFSGKLSDVVSVGKPSDVTGSRLHQPAMHLKDQTKFRDIPWTREGSAGAFLDPA